MNMIVVIAVISINFASVSATYGNKLNQYFDSYYNYYYHTVEGADTWLELDQYETDLFDVMWNKNDYWNKEDIIEAFDGTKIGMKCNSGYYNNADLCVCEVFRTGKKYQCRQYIENENAYKDYNNYYHDYSDNYRDADEMMVNDIASSANTAVLQYIDAQMQKSAVYNNFAQDDRSANSIMVKYGAIHFTSPVDAEEAAKKGNFVHITIQEDTLAFITWAMAQTAVNKQNFETWHAYQWEVPRKIKNDPDVMAMFHYFNLIKSKPDKTTFWKAIDGRKPPNNRHFRYNPRYNPHKKKKKPVVTTLGNALGEYATQIALMDGGDEINADIQVNNEKVSRDVIGYYRKTRLILSVGETTTANKIFDVKNKYWCMYWTEYH